MTAPRRDKAASSVPVRSVITFVLIWLGGSWLIVGTLLQPLLPGGWGAVVGVAVLMAIPISVILRGFGGVTYPSALTRLVVLRPLWYGMLFLPILAVAGMLGTLFGFPFGVAATVGRWWIAVALVVLATAALIGAIGNRRLVVRRLDVSLANLPDGLDGFRVVQISDLHIGPHTSRRFLRRVKRAVQDVAPDLIAITGDQVDDYGRDVEHFADAFGNLAAPHGVFAVAGNHDVYAGWDEVRRGMAEAGITVLVNEALPVVHNGQTIWIAGTGDPAGRMWQRNGGAHAAPNIEKTLTSVPPGAMTLALAHNPALWPALAERGVQLTLSGHTHHGQLSIPRLGWSLASPFVRLAMGSHRNGSSLLYISPGTGYWGVPLRIGALPEVTVLTLRRGDGAAIGFSPEEH